MRIISAIVAVACLLAFGYPAMADDSDNSGGNEVLTGTLLGGLLGGGVGTAIGSASGNAGKGALIGAGIGAIGGALLGSTQSSRRNSMKENLAEPALGNVVTESPDAPEGAKIKKRVIKQYDEQGNLISEKEVKN